MASNSNVNSFKRMTGTECALTIIYYPHCISSSYRTKKVVNGSTVEVFRSF